MKTRRNRGRWWPDPHRGGVRASAVTGRHFTGVPGLLHSAGHKAADRVKLPIHGCRVAPLFRWSSATTWMAFEPSRGPALSSFLALGALFAAGAPFLAFLSPFGFAPGRLFQIATRRSVVHITAAKKVSCGGNPGMRRLKRRFKYAQRTERHAASFAPVIEIAEH